MKHLLLAALALAPQLAAADVFENWSQLRESTEFETIAWRDGTGLARYIKNGEPAGYYLVDVDEHGLVKWFRHTDSKPHGRHAVKIGQGADAATTAIGLAQGFTETNPLGPGVFVAKIALIAAIENSSAEECYAGADIATQLGWGAAGANLITLAGGPITAAIGVGLATYLMSEPSEDELFWICAPG